MPIFTNNSTFPFHKFNMLDGNSLSSYSDIKKFIIVYNENTFREDFIKKINKNEMQHLFEIASIEILRFTFGTEYKKISESDINSESIIDKKLFVQLLNYRIDLDGITSEIIKFENSNDVSVDTINFLNDLIVFAYKFFFVKLANIIYCNKVDHLREPMNFLYLHKIFLRYSEKRENKKYSNLDYVQQKEFIENYFNSFQSDEIAYIEKTINELIIFSKELESRLYLTEIIEKYIKVNPSFTSKKQNKILLPFYKLITCVFFYRANLDLDLDDPKLIENFKKLRLSAKKRLQKKSE